MSLEVLDDRVQISAKVRVLVCRERCHAIERRTAHRTEPPRYDGDTIGLEHTCRLNCSSRPPKVSVLLTICQNHHNTLIDDCRDLIKFVLCVEQAVADICSTTRWICRSIGVDAHLNVKFTESQRLRCLTIAVE